MSQALGCTFFWGPDFSSTPQIFQVLLACQQNNVSISKSLLFLSLQIVCWLFFFLQFVLISCDHQNCKAVIVMAEAKFHIFNCKI